MSYQAHPTYFNKPPAKQQYTTGSQYFKDGKIITADSAEGKKLQQAITTTAISAEVNVKHEKLYADMSKAQSALEAWGHHGVMPASIAITTDPRSSPGTSRASPASQGTAPSSAETRRRAEP